MNLYIVGPIWTKLREIGERTLVGAIKTQIQDEVVKRIPSDIGSLDQFSDSTDLLENIGLRQRLKALYSL